MAKLSETFTVGGDYSAPAKKKLSETFSLNNDYSTPRTAKYTATPDNVIDDIPTLNSAVRENNLLSRSGLSKSDITRKSGNARADAKRIESLLDANGYNANEKEFLKQQSRLGLQDTVNTNLENFTRENKVAGSLLSIPLNAVAGTTGLAENVYNYVTGKPLSSDSAANSLYKGVSNMRSTASENLGKVGNTLYGAAMSGGDLLMSYLTGSAGLQAAEKAQATMVGAMDRGLTPTQVMAEGLASGITTYITEGKIFNNVGEALTKGLVTKEGEGAVRSLVKQIGKTALMEGGQEVAEGTLDILADQIIAGLLSKENKTELNKEYQDYIKSGLDKNDAVFNVVKDTVSQGIADFIGGALVGGALKGGALAIGQINTSGERRAESEQNRLSEEAESKRIAAEDIQRQNEAIQRRIEEEQQANQNELPQLLEEARTQAEAEAREEKERADRRAQLDNDFNAFLEEQRKNLVLNNPDSLTLYRGFNRSDNPLESNLVGVRKLSDFIPNLVEEDPAALPFAYYSESPEVANSYARQDLDFYNLVGPESYATLTGRNTVPTEGPTKAYRANPQNVLDLTPLGEFTDSDTVYNFLSEKTGLPQTSLDGNVKNLDDILQHGNNIDESVISTFPTFALMRNGRPNTGNLGTGMYNLMRDFGYDAVKYAEQGTNQYAFLPSVGAVEDTSFDYYNRPVESGDVDIDSLLDVPLRDAPSSADLRNEIDPTERVGFNDKSKGRRKSKNTVMAEDIGINPNTNEEIPTVEERVKVPSSKYDNTATDTIKSADDIPSVGDNKAVSQTREKLVERGLATEEEANAYFPKEDYTHNVTNIDRTVQSARADVDNRGFEAVFNDIGKAPTDSLSAEEVAKLQYMYQSAREAGDYENASRALRRLTQGGTTFGTGLRMMQEWAKTSPEGALAYTLSQAKNSVDKKMLKGGYADAVDNMADALTDAIKSNDDSAIEKVLKSNLSDFSSGAKAKRLKKVQIDGQMSIFDFIKEEKATGKSVSEIAEEAGRILKKNAGSVSLTSAQERQMLDYFTQMSGLDPNSYEYRQLQGKAMQILDAEMPTSLSNQIRTTLYDNMLGNLKTLLTRNAGGNAIGNAIEKAQRPLRAGIDKLVGNITGKRNYMLGDGIASEYKGGFKKGLTEQVSDLKSGVNTTRSGQNSLDDALDAVRTAYKKDKNGISKVLGKYDDVVKGVMTLGDRPFYEAEYAASKKELKNIVDNLGEDALQSVGVTDDALKSVDDTIEFLARERALEAVYQNKTLTSESFTKMKEFLGGISEDLFGVDVLSQTASPFVQVPANMLSRTMQYSPIGILSNAIKTARELGTGNFNQKRFVDALSRNITGAGLLAGAALLSNAGGITGSYADDPDKKKAQKDAGELEYALRFPNNTQIDVSDVPVLGPMLKAGSTVNESLKDNESTLRGLGEGTASAVGAMFDTSMMQGLNRVLGASEMYNSENNIFDNAKNTVLSGLTQAVPSLVRQASQTLDPYKRNLGEYGTGEYYLNNMLNSTPFRATLDVKKDREGNPVMQNNGRNLGMKALENFILPYTISQPQYSEVTQEANRLFDNGEGASGYIPNFTGSELKSLKGFDEKDYSYDKLQDLNQEYSEETSANAKALINSNFYKSLTDEEKAKALGNLYTAEKGILKEKTVREGKSASEIKALEDSKEIYTSNDTLTKKLKGGINSAIEYLEMKKAFDDVGIDTSNQNAQEVYEKSGAAGLQEAVNIARQNGINKMTSEQWETYNKLGVDAYRDKMQTAGVLNQYNLKDNEFNREYLATYGQESLPVLAEASDVIKTIEKGVDKYGDSTYLNVGESTVNVYNQYGKEGLEYYRDILTNDVDGNGKINDSDRIPTLQSMDIPNDEKGYLLAQSLGKLSDKAQAAVEIGGYEDLYTMYVLKNYLSENGLTKKTQIQSLLDSTGMSQDEKRYYFALLSSAKNPY